MIQEIKFDNSQVIRLDNFFKIKFPDISRTKIQKLITKGSIKVDDFIVKPSFKLKDQEIISYNDSINSQEPYGLLPEKMSLDIIYEDDYFIILNKPSGIVVHPGIGNKEGTLLNGLLYHYNNQLSSVDSTRPGVIHRLDKYTSGVMVFAKNDEIHYSISNQFAQRKVKKKYKALVWGNVIETGFIEGYIGRDPKNRLAFRSQKNKGKYAYTNYEVNKNFNFPISLLNIFPLTGRTHQIRVHLSSIGHPIVNDVLYKGDKKNTKQYHARYSNKIYQMIKKIDRIALHAKSIYFFHPIKKKNVYFEAPLPKDMIDAIKIISVDE